jgi:aspartyl-tRNA(Asn)/glutamyl-tRNA(Gln) amidotransferase subunit A
LVFLYFLPLAIKLRPKQVRLSMSDPAWLTITGIGNLFRTGELKPSELTEKLFSRIDQFNERLQAFLTLSRERAQKEAQSADFSFESGSTLNPLCGIPYAVKDLFDVQGSPTSAGCRFLSNNIALNDSRAVHLLSHAGMPILGKTHTVQFAFGGVGINHDQGTPLNPWKSQAYVPGGSSSGSAVAVASGMVPAALGTDTGGSVRIPAALCGIVGLKTTVGRISRSGVYPLSWTMDSVGVLTRSVEDAALLFQSLQGPDPVDAVTNPVPHIEVLSPLRKGIQDMRLAFCENVFFENLDPEVEQAVRETGRVFRDLGAQVKTREIPIFTETFSLKKRSLLVAAEACVINERLLKNHLSELDPIIADRMMSGWQLSAPDYFLVLKQWKHLQEKMIESLKDLDGLLVPTTMIPAKPVAEVDASPETYADFNGRYLRNTSLGNTLNLCAVSLPCGFTRQGLPIGLMVYAKPFQEDRALRIAYAYEQATLWHKCHPDAF